MTAIQITTFARAVYAACKKIPSGRVSTYQEIARFIDKPKAYRAVGNALNRNPFAPRVPCHRVVKGDGRVGGFASGDKDKIKLLQKEKVVIRDDRVVDFAKKYIALT